VTLQSRRRPKNHTIRGRDRNQLSKKSRRL
jgi:hypothetical protein